MPAGVEIFDAAGQPVLRITDRITKQIGTASTGTANGSVTNANLSQGTPWFAVRASGSAAGTIRGMPIVTISGTTVSWSFPFAFKLSCTIYYGTY